MSVENARFSFNRFSFRTAGAVGSQGLTEISSWSQVGDLERQVDGWDGQIVYAADIDELHALVKAKDAPTGFLDESVVCGGLPRDLPWMLEDVFNDYVDMMANIFNAPRWVKSAFASTLALAWKSAGYPKLDVLGLHTLAQGIYPALHSVVQTPSKSWWAPNPTIRGLEVFMASDSDAPEVAQVLTKAGTKTSTSEARKLIKNGMLAIRNFEDRLTALSALSKATLRVQARPDNDKILSMVEGLVKQAAEGEIEGADNYCYSCKKGVAKCKCSKSKSDFVTKAKSDLSKANGSGGEHRWGHLHASRPTIDSIVQGGALSVEVRDVMFKEFASEAPGWEEKLGRAVWFDVALFLLQCHQKSDVLKDLGSGIMRELMAASERAANVHKYAPTLFEEFEGPNAKLDGKFSEVYLGRDAIFAYHARQAQREVMRAATPLDERHERFSKLSEIRYVVISRTAKWITGVHSAKLGNHPAVFIDTGFAGSIPRMIATEEHLKIMDRPGARSQGKVLVQNGVSHIRLMSTGNTAYRFIKQWSSGEVNQIEMDAKPTQTAYAVDEATPTSALEQLVFRVLRREIRELSRRQTKELLNQTPGMGAIRTYADAMAFIEKQKEEAKAKASTTKAAKAKVKAS